MAVTYESLCLPTRPWRPTRERTGPPPVVEEAAVLLTLAKLLLAAAMTVAFIIFI
jgi:hypothetical protein